MIVVIILGLFCVLINLLFAFRFKGIALKISFVAIFCFMAFRYFFGNDYETYFDLFQRVVNNPEIAFDEKMYAFFEPGWLFLNWVCRPLGFFGMNILISAFYSLAWYKFIKKYVSPKYYWLSLFFFIFNPWILIVHTSIMRQMLAVTILTRMPSLVLGKRIKELIFIILLAGLFHYSALVILFLIPFFYNTENMGISTKVSLFLLYGVLLIFGPYLSTYLSFLSQIFPLKFDSYDEKGSASSGIGFLFYGILFFGILVLNFRDKIFRVFSRIVSAYFVLIPTSLVFSIFSRLGFFFLPGLIVLYPNILSKFKEFELKLFYILPMILFTIYQFIQFFYSKTYHDYFFIYKTIFSSNEWY